MKLLDFNVSDKRYCLLKLDNHNFSVREYLSQSKEIVIKRKVSFQEFKAPSNYYGTLEYALRKAFHMLGREFISKKEFELFTLPLQPLKTVFELKPHDIKLDNVDEVREMISKVMDYEK